MAAALPPSPDQLLHGLSKLEGSLKNIRERIQPKTKMASSFEEFGEEEIMTSLGMKEIEEAIGQITEMRKVIESLDAAPPKLDQEDSVGPQDDLGPPSEAEIRNAIGEAQTMLDNAKKVLIGWQVQKIDFLNTEIQEWQKALSDKLGPKWKYGAPDVTAIERALARPEPTPDFSSAAAQGCEVATKILDAASSMVEHDLNGDPRLAGIKKKMKAVEGEMQKALKAQGDEQIRNALGSLSEKVQSLEASLLYGGIYNKFKGTPRWNQLRDSFRDFNNKFKNSDFRPAKSVSPIVTADAGDVYEVLLEQIKPDKADYKANAKIIDRLRMTLSTFPSVEPKGPALNAAWMSDHIRRCTDQGIKLQEYERAKGQEYFGSELT